MRSNVTAFRRPRQLSGWLNDLADIAKEEGKAELKRRIEQKRQQQGGVGMSDHIAQQNWTVDQFRQILDAVNAGTMQPARAAILVESFAAEFEQYALAYGVRGSRGAADVRNLANQIKRDLAGLVNPDKDWFPNTTALSNNFGLIALVVGGFFLMSRRRR